MTSRKKPKTVVYCGPNIGNGLLQQNTVLNNGVPKFIENHIEECPAIMELMVPISELSTTSEKLKEKGSKENTMYQQIVEYLGSGK